MRISDWSSDVCSSDLARHPCDAAGAEQHQRCGQADEHAAGKAVQRLGVGKAGEYHSTSTGSLRRSEEHTSELQSLMRISYAVFCLKKKKTKTTNNTIEHTTNI